jgi:hypothetical protein
MVACWLLLAWAPAGRPRPRRPPIGNTRPLASVRQVLNIDLRGDGVDELLIVTQSGQIDLLHADGHTSVELYRQ